MAGKDVDEAGRYRLAPLRDARTRDEKVKRGDLAVAVGDARQTQTKLDGAKAAVAAAREALTTALASKSGLSGAAQLALADRFIARKRRELDRAIGEEIRAEAAHDERLGRVDTQRRVLARASADRKVIEQHFDRWRTEKRKLAERRED